jgi:hypothetical protein
MEQNPLHSTDLGYGVPSLFTEILDDLLDTPNSKLDFDAIVQDLLAQ